MRKIYIFKEDRRGFGNNLKELMIKNEYTIQSLADKLHFDINSVKKWRSGDRIPSLETLQELASLFGVTVHELYLPNSIYKKEISDELVQVIDKRKTISECNDETKKELCSYSDYLFQKMLFSFPTISDNKTMSSLFNCFQVTEYGCDKLDLNDAYDYKAFTIKVDEYLSKQYGLSFKYKANDKQINEILKEFDKWVVYKEANQLCN